MFLIEVWSHFVVIFFLIQSLFILPANLVRSGSEDRGKGSSDWVGKINTPNMTQIKMPINVLEGVLKNSILYLR